MTDPQRLADATLLPCPWGNATHHVRPTVVAVSGKSREQHCVTCDNCLSSGPIRETRADAIAAWNTRSSTAALEIGRAMGREEAAKELDAAAKAETDDDDPVIKQFATDYAAIIRSAAPEIDVEVLVEKVIEAIEGEVWVVDDKERVRGIEDAARAVLATLTARQQEK